MICASKNSPLGPRQSDPADLWFVKPRSVGQGRGRERSVGQGQGRGRERSVGGERSAGQGLSAVAVQKLLPYVTREV